MGRGWFCNGGMGIFKVSFYIVGTGVLTPVLWKPYIAYPSFQVLSNLPPLLWHLNPNPTVLSVIPFLWPNGLSHHIWCSILLTYITDIHKNHDVCFMQQSVRFTEVSHIMWFLLVLWFDITHTNTHGTLSG